MLKTFLSIVKESEVTNLEYSSETKNAIFDREKVEVSIEIIDVQSVEKYKILLFLNGRYRARFVATGIRKLKVGQEKHQVELKTMSGYLQITFAKK